jgi:hypothetical protein
VITYVWLAAHPEQYKRCHRDPAARMDVEAVGRGLADVCELVAMHDWPDAKAITVACIREAVKAANARAAPLGERMVHSTLESLAGPQMDVPSRPLAPDQFAFGGVVVSGFSPKQLMLLRFVKPAGVPMPLVLKHLGYDDDVNGRKAFNELRRRTQERMDKHCPRASYLLETINDHICLLPRR